MYKIDPASLIPGDAEYIFESEEDLKAGAIFERVGRRLFIERVEDDDSNPETETSAIKDLVREEMCGAYPLDPPLAVDVGVGDDWNDAKS